MTGRDELELDVRFPARAILERTLLWPSMECLGRNRKILLLERWAAAKGQ